MRRRQEWHIRWEQESLGHLETRTSSERQVMHVTLQGACQRQGMGERPNVNLPLLWFWLFGKFRGCHEGEDAR